MLSRLYTSFCFKQNAVNPKIYLSASHSIVKKCRPVFAFEPCAILPCKDNTFFLFKHQVCAFFIKKIEIMIKFP